MGALEELDKAIRAKLRARTKLDRELRKLSADREAVLATTHMTLEAMIAEAWRGGEAQRQLDAWFAARGITRSSMPVRRAGWFGTNQKPYQYPALQVAFGPDDNVGEVAITLTLTYAAYPARLRAKRGWYVSVLEYTLSEHGIYFITFDTELAKLHHQRYRSKSTVFQGSLAQVLQYTKDHHPYRLKGGE